MEYENIKARCIEAYRDIYKDSLCFDYCKVPKEMRIRLLEDEEYIAETKAAKAELYLDQLKKLNSILNHNDGIRVDEKNRESSQVILKALEMKNKLLFQDLAIDQDESKALNVSFIAMTREEFIAFDTVDVYEGENNIDDS